MGCEPWHGGAKGPDSTGKSWGRVPLPTVTTGLTADTAQSRGRGWSRDFPLSSRPSVTPELFMRIFPKRRLRAPAVNHQR